MSTDCPLCPSRSVPQPSIPASVPADRQRSNYNASTRQSSYSSSSSSSSSSHPGSYYRSSSSYNNVNPDYSSSRSSYRYGDAARLSGLHDRGREVLQGRGACKASDRHDITSHITPLSSAPCFVKSLTLDSTTVSDPSSPPQARGSACSALSARRACGALSL